MGPRDPDQELRSGWLAVAMQAFFQPGDVDATLELNLADGPFRVEIEGDRIDIGPGHAPDADLRMTVDDEALLGYLRGEAPAPKAEGDQKLLRRLPADLRVQPLIVSASRTMFSATITAATAHATTVVSRRLTSSPISERSRVKRTSGISAKGIPNESTTWLSTRADVAFTPTAMTISAGAIVIVRRRNSGIRRWMKPCMTT